MTLLKTLQDISTRQSKGNKYPALMTHVVLGYPTLKESIELVRAMADGGARLIELQIPFSDPMADGPTIMAANEAALASGIKVKDCFKAAEKISRQVHTPLLFMSYFNILFNYKQDRLRRSSAGGVAQFCKDASNAGIQGLIVPDVPPEENEEGYWSHSQKYGILPVPIVSPISDTKRLHTIQKISNPAFVYCVSTTGTTGARKKLPPGLAQYLKQIKKHFSVPIGLGFGISTPEQVKSLNGLADIAIVGSAMIETINRAPKAKRIVEVRKFTTRLSGIS